MLAKLEKQKHEANLSKDTVKIRGDSSRDNRNIVDVNSSRTDSLTSLSAR